MVRNSNDSDISFIIDGLSNFSINEKIENIIHHPFKKFLICEFSSSKVGFMEYSLYYDRIEIDYIFIQENFRKMGLASELLEFLIQIYRSKNINNITLEVSSKNVPALKLYQKHDFEIVAIRDNYYGNGDSALLMIRRF